MVPIVAVRFVNQLAVIQHMRKQTRWIMDEV